MKLGSVNQQPSERLSYTVNYSQALSEGDGINASDVSVEASPGGLVVDRVRVVDTRVKFWVSGGAAGTAYKVTLTVGTDEGCRFEDEVFFKIKEV